MLAFLINCLRGQSIPLLVSKFLREVNAPLSSLSYPLSQFKGNTKIYIVCMCWPIPNAATTSVVSVLKYKEAILEEIPGMSEESEITRYVI